MDNTVDNTDTLYSVCGMCSALCPLEITRREGRPVWLCGNPHTASHRALCPRGAAGLALLEDDEVPHGPLIRTGARGEGRWRECGWDEALDYVVARLQNIMASHGPQSLLWSENLGMHSDYSQALLRALGSPNYCTHEVTCSYNGSQAAYSLLGCHRQELAYDYAHCQRLVLQGRNIFEALVVDEVNAVLDAMARGCRVTALDVRTTITACKAHEFLLLRPGSDYAFNLAILQTLISENLYDAAYAAEHIAGLDALKTFVQPYTPAWAAHECGVEAVSIVRLAREVAAAAPAVIWHPGWMSARYKQSFLISRSAYMINALLGSIGRRGGIIPLISPEAPPEAGPEASAGAGSGAPSGAGPEDQPEARPTYRPTQSLLQSLQDLYPAPASKRADGVGWKYPQLSPRASLLHEALQAALTNDPYPVRAYVACMHDPLTALPDPEEVRRRLQGLDLLVALTWSWSDTAWYADVVLPVSSPLERNSPLMEQPGLCPRILMGRAATAPRYNTRADWEIFSGLAARLGFDKLVFADIEALWAFQLQGTGYSIADVADKGFLCLSEGPVYPPLQTFPTPSGKLELQPAAWTEAGRDVLAPYCRCPAPPAGTFRLIVGRVALHTQAHSQNNRLLAAEMPENTVWLHSSRARALQLQTGELVRLESATGLSALVRVFLTEGIHPEAAFMLHGFGHSLPMELRAHGKGAADQEFMPGGLHTVDSLSAAPALQEHFVAVHKIQRGGL